MRVPALLVATLCACAWAASADALTRQVIGQSREGRPIQLLHTGDPTGPRVLVVGCIHGNECAGRAITRALEHADLAIDLWIIPTLNPDGAAAGTRQNAAGVDLNRNWPVGWRAGGRRWSTYYPGPRPWSEPETRVARDLIGRLNPRLTIWYHQHMDLVWAYGQSAHAGARYATAAGMRLYRKVAPHGAATGWQHAVAPRARAFVVELPAGALHPTATTRHVTAIAQTAVGLAP